ncbi:MAG TPA: DNRLRE domain-containing protein [Chthoniobacterales bacterium]
MKSYKALTALTALLLFATMRSGTFADTVSLLPQKDNTLYEDPAGQLSNGQGIYLFAGMTDDNGLRRGLIAFDLASIPTNATITGATLSMFLSRSGPSSAAVNISLSKALRDWGEGASDAGSPGGMGAPAEAGDATWLHTFYDTNFWTTPGGDFSPTPSATTPVSKVNTTYTWSGSGLLADLQSWVSNPASNFGWVILANEIDVATAQRLNTRENSNNPPQLTVTYQVLSQAINLSTRMRVQTGDNIGIGGFIITGSAPKHVLLRAIGPTLSHFGIADLLADPVLELHGPGAFVTITNDNWRDTQEAQIAADGIPPTNDFESAIDATLAPGAYTALVKGKNNSSGVALVEVYDLDQAALSRLANLSTRAFVSTGDNVVIAGFLLSNNGGSDRIVLRALGPSLSAAGVPNVLANPTLELHDTNGTLILANNDWQDNAVQAAIVTAAGLAPSNNFESAIAATLPPGLYTALLAGLNNGTGIGLVEVYDLGAP